MKRLSEAIPLDIREAVAQAPVNIILDEPRYACNTCMDRGVIVANVPYGDPRFGKPMACPDCERGYATLQRQWRGRLIQSGLPEMYQQFTFDTWNSLPDYLKDKKRLAAASAWLFTQSADHSVDLAAAYELCGRKLGASLVKRSLILQGPYGTGKTGIAAAIVNVSIQQGRPALYTRTQDFLESIKARFGKDGPPTAEDIVNTVKTAPVLILDEFNMAAAGEWRQEQMENVIRHRYGNNLPTVVTCNASKDELTEQWGGRTTHVLFSMSHWIPMGGVGLREGNRGEGELF